MPLENGIASVATASRLLSGIDEELFSYAFMEWIGEILKTRGIHIVIDGKALKAAGSKVRGTRAPMILNALDAATGLVIAQLPIADKSCELAGLPKLLELLDIRESTVTIDAIGTHTNIMESIVRKNGHFVFMVKKNQPDSYAEITSLLEELSEEYKKAKENAMYISKYAEEMESYTESVTCDKNRDRHEYRTYRSCHAVDWLTKTESEWSFVRTIGQAKQVRILSVQDKDGNDITPDPETFLKEGSARQKKPESDDDEATVLSVGMVSDRILSAAEMGKYKREHWVIENALHYVLDSSFQEDRSPAKKSRNNLALIRKFVYNIIRIASLRETGQKPFLLMMDEFADDLSFVERYVFKGIESLD